MTNVTGKWRVLQTDLVFSAEPFIRVDRQRIALPTGQVVDDYYNVDLGDFACVYPMLPDGRVLVLRQYRHGVGRTVLNFPGGHCRPGEAPGDAARRELLEETGYTAGSMELLPGGVIDGNKRCGQAHLFIARNCAAKVSPDASDLECGEIVILTPRDLIDAATRGDIAVLPHLGLLALATHPLFGCCPTSP